MKQPSGCQWAHAVLVISIHMLGVDHFDPSIPNRGLRVEIHIKSLYSLLVLSSLFHWIPSWRTSFWSIPNYVPWLNCDTFTASALFQGCKCVDPQLGRGANSLLKAAKYAKASTHRAPCQAAVHGIVVPELYLQWLIRIRGGIARLVKHIKTVILRTNIQIPNFNCFDEPAKTCQIMCASR